MRVAEHGDVVGGGRVGVLHDAAPGLLLGEEDALGGVELVDALHGADVDAGAVLGVDARLGDDGDAAHVGALPRSRRTMRGGPMVDVADERLGVQVLGPVPGPPRRRLGRHAGRRTAAAAPGAAGPPTRPGRDGRRGHRRPVARRAAPGPGRGAAQPGVEAATDPPRRDRVRERGLPAGSLSHRGRRRPPGRGGRPRRRRGRRRPRRHRRACSTGGAGPPTRSSPTSTTASPRSPGSTSSGCSPARCGPGGWSRRATRSTRSSSCRASSPTRRCASSPGPS